MTSWNIKESHYYINLNNKERLCHRYLTLDIWFTKQFSIGYDYKYDTIDYWMIRPIHKNMSVAPPWAKMNIVKVE